MPDSIQEEKIPFLPNQQSGLEELAGGSPIALNITADALGAVTRRPGFSAYSGGPSGIIADSIDGLYETAGGTLYAVRTTAARRHILKLTPGASLDISDIPSGDLRGTLRPIFAETEDRLVIVAGDAPEQVLLATNAPSPLSSLAPMASHVAANRARLLLNDRTQFPWVTWFSDVSGGADGGYQAWNAASASVGTGSASSFQSLPNREPCLAMADNSDIIFCWGRTRMAIFVPDPQIQYNPETSKELGISAPYSVIKVDQSFGWLDHLRRFVLSDGRNETPLSDPYIQATLNNMTTVNDCFGWRFLHGNTDALVWTFPTDGRTFVFQKGSGWSQWQSGGSPWGAFPVRCHVRRTSNDDNVIGTNDGQVGFMEPSITTDFGVPFTASVTTGFINHGTSRLKACRAVRITLRRGESGSVTEPVGFLSWRDNLGEFTPGVAVGFGSPSDHTVVVRLPSVGGTYRRRQWKWTFSGVGQMALADVSEEFEVLGS